MGANPRLIFGLPNNSRAWFLKKTDITHSSFFGWRRVGSRDALVMLVGSSNLGVRAKLCNRVVHQYQAHDQAHVESTQHQHPTDSTLAHNGGPISRLSI